MGNHKLDEVLSGASVNLSAQMSGGCVTVYDHLGNFCNTIVSNGLKPWGRKGRQILNEGIKDMVEAGAYESWQDCLKCKKSFRVSTNAAAIDAFLKYWKEEMDYDELVRCGQCGGRMVAE